LNRLSTDFGVVDVPLRWIRSYLSGRTFFVRLGSSSSPTVSSTSGVPQGSVLGPVLFTAYVSPIGRLIQNHEIDYHCYADDTQLYTALDFNHSRLSKMESCINELQCWFWKNDLLLNPDKSETILLGTTQRLSHSPTYLSVVGSNLAVSKILKTLGVTLDSSLTFANHVNNVVQSCNFHLRSLQQIRHSLPLDIANTIACSIVGSRLDYCNSLPIGSSSSVQHTLQRIQNNLARTVCNVKPSEQSVDRLLRDLHWLPVNKRIIYKTALIVHKVLRVHQPSYLSPLLTPYTPSRSLRSSGQGLLKEPKARLEIGTRCFSHSAPRIWNSLPTPSAPLNNLYLRPSSDHGVANPLLIRLGETS
jgi:Reverse transcriptase (RNA-dependent DNA polymerase)